MTWQPIESAPKDGRWIMTWNEFAIVPAVLRWSADIGDWTEVNSDDDKAWDGTPTHWAPIPAPPQQQEPGA